MNLSANRWFWASPLRMLTWFLLTPVACAAVAIRAFDTRSVALGVIFGLATALSIWEGFVYAPRAWRATRRAN